MIYTTESFIVNEELCLALIDKRVTCDMELELKRRNIEIIDLAPNFSNRKNQILEVSPIYAVRIIPAYLDSLENWYIISFPESSSVKLTKTHRKALFFPNGLECAVV